ncbi:hypothetical protein J0H58_10625 [bacterium]|nr:hypothetical protein [bacterium]
MLDRLTAAEFEPLLGVSFAAELPHGVAALDLIEVTRLREPPACPGGPVRRHPFSLVFRACAAGYLPQGTFVLTHDRLGRLDVFLVPVGRDADGWLLEAVFN